MTTGTKDPTHAFQRKRTGIGRQLRRAIYLFLLLSIFFAANAPVELDRVASAFWRILAPLGLDVAMTPITHDMALMLDPRSGETTYTRQMWIEVLERDDLPETVARIEISALDFHRFRIPLLLMMELQSNRVPTPGHIAMICRTLSSVRKAPVRAWRLIAVPERDDDAGAGFNRVHPCRAEDDFSVRAG